MARIHVEGYGCSASQADSEIISGVISGGGHELVPSSDGADLCVMVTCSVKDATAHRMMHRMKELGSRPLIVAGCMPKAEPDTVRRIAGGASMMGPGAVGMALDVVESALAGERREELGDTAKAGLPRVRLNRTIGIVEIASGCLSECTFCQTKLAKGGLSSYRPGDIARQVSSDVADGCREIWLTSTDNGCYGLDIGTDLPYLMGVVSGVSGDFMVRVGMMNPMYVPRMAPRLLDSFEDPKIFKFLHMPVQSGSDRILYEMGRGHTSHTFLDMAGEARRRFGQFTISTDIIVGFPGETEEDFAGTIKLLEDARPDVVNLSRYSKRPGTEAATRAQLDDIVVKERSRELHGRIRNITLDRNKKWIGWRGMVLFDERAGDETRGRNAAYKPVFVREETEIGESHMVEITGATPNALLGQIAS